MHQSEHAQAMTQRFRELVESSGDTIPDSHYDELVLIIESGLDTGPFNEYQSVVFGEYLEIDE